MALNQQEISSANIALPLVSGRYYTAGFTAQALANTAVGAVDRLYALPIPIAKRVTLTKIGISVTTGTAGTAADQGRLGIFADSNGVPGALVLDAGTVAVNANADVEIAISQILNPGWYWLAAVFNTTPTVKSTATTNVLPWMGYTSLAMGTRVSQVFVASAFGTLPTTFGTATAANAAAPVVAISY